MHHPSKRIGTAMLSSGLLLSSSLALSACADAPTSQAGPAFAAGDTDESLRAEALASAEARVLSASVRDALARPLPDAAAGDAAAPPPAARDDVAEDAGTGEKRAEDDLADDAG